MAQIYIIPSNTLAPARPAAQPNPVFLTTSKSGTYIVRDAARSKGGTFATAKAARRFIKHEFGSGAHVVEDDQQVLAFIAA
ncbi:MAG TPA: hypothetical protein ENJ57_08425 [Rhizobiales bacterium]|nr:hypothetical protein [Hyphomicrobiales bacterium]